MGWRQKKQVTNNNGSGILLENNNSFIEPMQEFAPKNYQAIEPLANAMILQKSIKINLTNTVATDRRRIIDFLCGISYVVGFVVDKTDNNVYEFKLEN